MASEDDARLRMMEDWARRAEARFAKRRAAMRAHWAATSPATHFNVYDIAAWADLADRAGVPHIPLEKLCTWNVDDIVGADAPKCEDIETLNRARKRLREGKAVARWSHCAGAMAKFYMGAGGAAQGWSNEMIDTEFDDDRFYELLMDYPEPTFSLYRREWVDPLVVDEFPVEYRVFVFGDVVSAISNYYPQRDLPNTRQTLRHISTAFACVAMMVRAQRLPLNLPPWALEGHDPDAAAAILTASNCTIDFMARASGGLTMIDAGPAFGMGADPCCFPFDGIPDGIALEDRSGRSARHRSAEE